MLQNSSSIASTRRCLVRLGVSWGLVGAVGAGASPARSQPAASGTALTQAIVVAEHARASDPAGLAPILAGLESPSPDIQQLAVRALGRLERPSLVPLILPVLGAGSAPVRAEAANALAQAVQGRGARELSTVVGALRERLAEESDGGVRGVIYDALGRLPYDSPEMVREAEALLRQGAGGHGRDQSPSATLGAVKGLEALFRLQAKLARPEPATLQRLGALARGAESAAAATTDAVRVRRLALGALTAAGAADAATVRAALDDTDALVRRQAAVIATSQETLEDRPAIIARALADASPLVRFEAVLAHAKHQRATTCAPLVQAAGDPAPHVAMSAIDALSAECPPAEHAAVVRALEAQVATLPAGAAPGRSGRVDWHRAAHALVALASVAKDQAAAALPRFLAHPVWQVRMYAARAAAPLEDAATLERLASGDAHDNVRTAALTGLTRLRAHAADGLYLAALSRSDHQLIRAAARALAGTPNVADAVEPLVAALARLSASKKDNTRDARVAILTTLKDLRAPARAPDLKPYLADFDPRVAALAAETLTAWTGVAHAAQPAKPAVTAPVLSQLEPLEKLRVKVVMQAGGEFELRLFPSEAPATVDRFVRLVRAGYYNGLTFHRVVPNWVIQGGSPGANEYVGDSPFMPDEVGLRPHLRGSVGISTRGRDTGDAQIFVDLADNFRLDHGYTVFGEVTRGMDVVDGVIEGDIIQRIEVGPVDGTASRGRRDDR